MKKALLLLIPSLFLVTACGGDEETNETCPECCKKHVDNDFDGYCDICGYDMSQEEGGDENQHATSLSLDPSAPFYLKVGEEKKIAANPSPTPTLDVEKEMLWTNYNQKVVSLEIDSKDSRKAVVKGLSAGSCNITAKNKDNPSLSKTFNITVVDFDEENDYLWQFNNDDKALFGYLKDERPEGFPSGTANLGKLTWSYSRSEAIAIYSEYGGLKFGKSKQPETHVHLENDNFRTVNKMAFEVASAQGLANMTVKVGDTTVIDRKVPKANYSTTTRISTEGDLNLTGKITIDFDTPAYDPIAQEQDPEKYKEPGAVVLKSILINYGQEPEPEYKTESTLDFVQMFNDKDTYSEFWSGVNGTTHSKDYEKDDIKYHFEKIKTDNTEGKNQHFNINAPITFSVPEGEVVSKVEFKYHLFGSTSVIYGATGSIVNGEPYSVILSDGGEEQTSFRVYQHNINSVKLSSSKTTNVGLVSLTVKTVVGTHAEIDDVKFAVGAAPTKLKYNVGESFIPEGLGNAIATFKDSTSNLEIPLECFKFYDGASYDADPETATNVLTAASTYVYGVYRGFVCKIEGIEVENLQSTYSLVRSLEDIGEGGSFLFVNVATKSYWKGTSATGTVMKGADGVGTFNIPSLGETIEVPQTLNAERVKITKTANDTYKISTALLKVGLTASNAISIVGGTSTPAYEEWELRFSQGIAEFKITGNAEKSGTVKYLGFDESGLKFNIYATSKLNISLYKIVED